MNVTDNHFVSDLNKLREEHPDLDPALVAWGGIQMYDVDGGCIKFPAGQTNPAICRYHFRPYDHFKERAFLHLTPQGGTNTWRWMGARVCKRSMSGAEIKEPSAVLTAGVLLTASLNVQIDNQSQRELRFPFAVYKRYPLGGFTARTIRYPGRSLGTLSGSGTWQCGDASIFKKNPAPDHHDKSRGL